MNALASFAVQDLHLKLADSEDHDLLDGIADDAYTHFRNLTAPKTRAELAQRQSAFGSIGDIHSAGRDENGALAAYEAALELEPIKDGFEKADADSAPESDEFWLAQTLTRYGEALLAAREMKRARANFDKAEAAWLEVGRGHEARPAGLAGVYRAKSRLHEIEGKLAKAIEAVEKEKDALNSGEQPASDLTLAEVELRHAVLLKKAREIQRALAIVVEIESRLNMLTSPENDPNWQLVFMIAQVHRCHAGMLRDSEPPEPERALEHFSASLEQLAKRFEPPVSWEAARAGVNEEMALLYAARGEFLPAIARETGSLVVWQTLFNRDNSNDDWRLSLAKAHLLIGNYKSTANLPFRQHWKAGMELAHGRTGPAWKELRGELDALRGVWRHRNSDREKEEK